MNPIAEEIASYLGSAELTDKEFIEHYGVKRRSGRYPYGSGKDPHQHGRDFLSRVDELKKTGWKETPENIKKEFGLSTSDYRREKSIAKDERRMLNVNTAKRLQEKEGLGATEIGKRMGVNESTVRSWLNQENESKMLQTRNIANDLKKQIQEKKMIDVGVDVEKELNISRERLDTALRILEREGYHVYSGRIPQPTNKNQSTTQKVLTDKDKEHKDIFKFDEVKTITDYISRDGGETLEKKFTYPSSMDSKRVKVRYKEDGGELKDGIVEIRRGVEDLSLGKSRYAQVRILVDGTHYIKGMAVYSDNMPDGVDIVFNTNKKKDTPALGNKDNSVLKPIKKDPDNPFGANIKDSDQGGQYWYTDKNGKKKLGLINKAREEGDWSEWADALPSQFLSKQSLQLAKKQLDLAKATKEAEYNEIMSLNNPTLKKYYLDKFASSCDGAAQDLKAAALPGQKYHVIVPNNTLKETEIYAPQYAPGTKLALVRYPHGGTFEIPILTVTDKNALAKKWIGTSSVDAVCINKKVADRLSGADFDGDTVMCIPTHDSKRKVKIINQDELKDLKGFDPKLQYRYDSTKIDADGTVHYYKGDREFKPMKKASTNLEMGKISNLITDMTLAGADTKELARAVKHSMVVIDAEKHKLDYKKSYIDNNIASLQEIYQPKYDSKGNLIGGGGASTIISRAKGELKVERRKGQPKINMKGKPWYNPDKPEGSLLYTKADDKDLYYADSTYNKKTGVKTVITTNGKKITYNMNSKEDRDKYEPVMRKDPKTGEVYYTNKDKSISYRTKFRTVDSTNMAETDDATTLMSVKKHPMERLYADYANSMKAMANTARKSMMTTGNLEYNPNAAKIYKNEVSSLMSRYNTAAKNSVKERAALRIANVEISKKKALDPDMSKGDIKKLSQRELSKAREQVGTISRRKRALIITDKEWEAIQAGAISDNKLKEILKYTDPDTLRERAMPKSGTTLNTAQINRIKAMNNSNFTLNQIAEKMNLSPSTVSKYLKGVK